MPIQVVGNKPLYIAGEGVVSDPNCCCGTCCSELPSSIPLKLEMVNGIELPNCAELNLTLVKVGPFLWRAVVTGWCTDPADFDVEFTCSVDPDDPQGGEECITDFWLRVVISGVPEPWANPDGQCDCNLCGQWLAVSGINDSLCCNTTPGSLTATIGDCSVILAAASSVNPNENELDDILNDEEVQKWQTSLSRPD